MIFATASFEAKRIDWFEFESEWREDAQYAKEEF